MAGEGLSTKWMEDLVLCCGSGMQRFSWTVNVESTESFRNYRSRQEEADRISVQRDRDSIFVVVEKKSRQMEDQ